MKISGAVAFVTGAASGLGSAVATELEAAGAQVTCFDPAFRNNSETDRRVEYPGSVASESDVVTALARSATHFGQPAQIIINCAGIGLPGQRIAGPRGALALEDFMRVVEVNLTGTFNVMRLGAQNMLSMHVPPGEERGVIINVSSINAEDGPVGTLPYSCSKAAVCGMTLPAARDLGPCGIRVNCILPGCMETPMLRTMSDDAVDYVTSNNPFPKRPGDPAEFASLARHMIENSAINGVNYRLDCGARLSFEQ